MSEKKKEISRQSDREDEMLKRAFLWMAGAALLMGYLLFLNRYYIRYHSDEIGFMAVLLKLMPVFAGVEAAGCLAFGGLAWRAGKLGKRVKWLAALSVFFGGMLICTALVWRFNATAVQVLCGVILAAAVLALVYYLYQREFFLIAFCSALGIMGLWLIRRAAGTIHTGILYAYLAAAAVILAAVTAGVWKLQKNGGMWKQHRILHKKTVYPLVYATCGMVAVLLAAGLALGPAIAFYLMFPVIGWIIVMAVYFTVRLM